jgi:hypothetical protein
VANAGPSAALLRVKRDSIRVFHQATLLLPFVALKPWFWTEAPTGASCHRVPFDGAPSP